MADQTPKQHAPVNTPAANASVAKDTPENPPKKPASVTETGGPKGLEPTRYGDWEQNGRCTDF